MISIIIPLYNKGELVRKTLQSVFAQTFQDFEVIIVNDGSTDNSAEVVASISDPRIRLITQKNAGVSAARNRGISEAKGEYIALLDADDEWKPEYLATQMALAEKYPECDVFATRYEFCDEYKRISKSVINGIPSQDDFILEKYFHIASHSDAPLWTSAVVITKKALLSVEGFPSGITSGEDLLTWAQLACKYKIAYCNNPGAIYYTPTTGPTGKVPVDLTSVHDAVGSKLIELSARYPEAGVNEYISFWYKMRSAINLRRRNRVASFLCAFKSITYRFINSKSWALMFLSFAPGFIIKKTLGR